MKLRYISIVTICLLVMGCASLSRYDDHTYRSMTDLKGEVKIFMDDCTAKGASGEKAATAIEGFRVKLSQAYEYEAGKTKNSETTSQMKILREIFNDLYERFAKNKIENGSCVARKESDPIDLQTGCLSKGYCSGKLMVLETAFDIAISTEALKNK